MAWRPWSDFYCSWQPCTLVWMSGCKRSSCEGRGLANINSAGETPMTACGVNWYLIQNWASFISREPLTNLFSPSFMVWTARSGIPVREQMICTQGYMPDAIMLDKVMKTVLQGIWEWPPLDMHTAKERYSLRVPVCRFCISRKGRT